MVSIVERLELRPDELAFHFASDQGVEVEVLANFLKRAAKIAGRRGAELRVVGLANGSLVVRLKAIPKSKAAQNAAAKFIEDPLDQTLKATGLVGAIAGALIWAFGQANTPLAKAGTEIVEKHHVTEISVITNVNTVVVMDGATAAAMAQARQRGLSTGVDPDDSVDLDPSNRSSKHRVTVMVEEARLGNLTGVVEVVDGAIHFRPDGYHFWVPVRPSLSSSPAQFAPGGRYRIGGKLETLRGQPDSIVVQTAELISIGQAN